MKKYYKRFLDWIMIKISLERSDATLPFFNEGEVWWCSIGENVGTEIGGKGEYFRRPVVVLTKLDRRSFIGIPLTSKNKKGSWYFSLQDTGIGGTAHMAQVRYLDCMRMNKIAYAMNQKELIELQDAYIKNRSPAHKERVVVGNPKLDTSINIPEI